MDSIDATNRTVTESTAPPPSLLIIILDTSPPSWAHLTDTLPISTVLKTLIVFINAHLALNHANRVAVLASHIDRVQWLYPTPLNTVSSHPATNGAAVDKGTPKPANKYMPFLTVEQELRSNLQSLLSTTPSSTTLSNPPLLSASLSTALTYANMQALLSEPTSSVTTTNALASAGSADLDAHTNAVRNAAIGPQLVTRILVFSVSRADLSGQYIALMNAVFAAQRLNVPIDMLRVGGRTAFLQQASDATGGVFLNYDPLIQAKAATNGATSNGARPGEVKAISESNANAAAAGLLQTLLMAYLPDITARKHLVAAGSAEVDFRAACFCHGDVVSLAGVCSVCLSIFCIPLSPGMDHCPTCQSTLRIPKSLSIHPAVVPRKKKKKKRGVGGVDGRAETPGLTSGAATPSHTMAHGGTSTAGGTPMR